MCFDVCELCKRLDSKILITSVSFECRVIMTGISLTMFFIKPPMQHLLNRKKDKIAYLLFRTQISIDYVSSRRRMGGFHACTSIAGK